MFVSAYTVTREYGGPEEGGWWYDEYTLRKAVRVNPDDDEQITRITQALEVVFGDERWGNISSVLGGQDVRIIVEDSAGANATTERPHYE